MLCNDTEGSCYGVFDSTWFEVGTIAFIIFFVFNYNMASKSQSGFRVLVAGGGIAGLTLANCLERAGVEYILLEAHDNVAPRVGASIGLLPNGSRILDQLGCYDKILEETQGVRITRCLDQDGNVFHISDGVRLLETRFNYAISYLERETVLRVLYENLHDKSPIHLLRRITSVDHSGTDGVVVHCQDGTIVAGDVLVGCDGVNSLVRREMWRLSEHDKPQATPESVRNGLKAEFQCLFGLSTRTRGVNAGEMDVNFASGFSTMVIGGKGGRVFWFVFAKMDKTYTSPNIPKYSYEDAVAFANEYMDFTIKDGLKFSDLWQSRTSVTLAATEEAELKEWTWGRIACVGDNVHKMTPHMGAGGNAAMESAATLANELRKLGQAAKKTKIDIETVQRHLETYQRGRRDRTSAVCDASAQLARLQALDSVASKFIAFWILPTAGDLLVDVNCDMIIGAAKLDYIPTPERSVQGTMPFNPSLGLGKGESKLKRGFAGLPLLALSLFGPWLVEPSNLAMVGKLTPLFLSYDHASNSIRAWPYTGVLAASSGLDVMRFHLDFGIICAVVLFESSRRANVLTISSLPIAFFYCLQSFKIVQVMGVYCFAHYVQSPIENFRAKDMRLTNRAYSGTVLVTLLVAYYVPLVTAIMPVFSITTRLTWGYVFQYFPFSISILQNGLKHLFLEDVMDEDKIRAPDGDLSLIGLTIFTSSRNPLTWSS
ncbi:FAD-dependent monooxygenase BOA8 like protein [Verticillium longisporum]|uniref:FAD-dependent monooxygenase BOA8 like protein n=1 Tax=Verticillium longisporum TaxID=100787 RepID=A0A8I3AWY0_VERLO|nr:FAD-dependent monooxygenase BOA8 like protein [Verticillium longisporum]